MTTKWLYCFQDGASHLFTQNERGDWICPVCGFIRSKSEIEAVEESWRKQDAEAENDNLE